MTSPASAIDEVSLPSDNESCEDNLPSQSKERPDMISTSSRNQQIGTTVMVGSFCMVLIVVLFASAFNVEDPNLESSADCVDAVTSETATAIIAFVIGWAFCYIAKRHRNLAGQMSEVICSAKQLSGFVCSSASSIKAWLANQGPRLGKILALTLVGVMCAGCIIALFVSAFTAVPDEEPTDTVFASESSQTMKAFTVGWMFLLTFKLRSELVGLVGSSSFLHPC
jgi:cytochrome bd-type quinol oxidase subunit 2